jgi:nucleotide-binding universal stress UspA family protein
VNPVVVAYDGSEPASAALDAAARLFPGHPAAVVSVWDSMAGAASASLVAVPAAVAVEAAEKIDEASERQATQLADEGAARLRSGGLEAVGHPVKSHGNAWSTIVEFAERQEAEVVVVGSRGRSGVKSVLLGSVSSGVVHHSTRPVLVVHA